MINKTSELCPRFEYLHNWYYNMLNLQVKISWFLFEDISLQKLFMTNRTAFACWILANIFLQSVSRYVAYLTGIIGGLQWLTCFIWFLVHNPIPLVIPFEDGAIEMTLGTHFWMTFICGDWLLSKLTISSGVFLICKKFLQLTQIFKSQILSL